MPRLPDLSAYTFDQLQTLISAVNKKMDDIRGKRIKELQAELNKLGTNGANGVTRGREVASRGSRKAIDRERATLAGRSVPAKFRGPNGEEYSGRGAIPRWARSLGINDRAELEKYRIK